VTTLVLAIFCALAPASAASALVIAGVIKRARYQALATAGAEAEGEIVRMAFMGKGNATPRAVVEFEDDDGEVHEVEATVGTPRWRDFEGGAVMVAYDPKRPAVARIREDALLWSEAARRMLPVLVLLALLPIGLWYADHIGWL